MSRKQKNRDSWSHSPIEKKKKKSFQEFLCNAVWIGLKLFFFICNLKCFSYFWSGTLIMEFWFQAWKCPFYAPLRFQTHNEIMIAVWPAAAAVIWHVYHSIKTPNTLKITFDSYSKYIEYNIHMFFYPL